MLKTKAVSCLGGVLMLITSPAFAHHSVAQFDNTRKETVSGTVKEWDFVNPHSWLHVVAKNAETGETEEWQFEGNTVYALAKAGWTRLMMKPGDKVEVEFSPSRNGSTVGMMYQVKLQDGTMMCAAPFGCDPKRAPIAYGEDYKGTGAPTAPTQPGSSN